MEPQYGKIQQASGTHPDAIDVATVSVELVQLQHAQKQLDFVARY